jgi:hypothetical protein
MSAVGLFIYADAEQPIDRAHTPVRTGGDPAYSHVRLYNYGPILTGTAQQGHHPRQDPSRYLYTHNRRSEACHGGGLSIPPAIKIRRPRYAKSLR